MHIDQLQTGVKYYNLHLPVSEYIVPLGNDKFLHFKDQNSKSFPVKSKKDFEFLFYIVNKSRQEGLEGWFELPSNEKTWQEIIDHVNFSFIIEDYESNNQQIVNQG
jgi:hypothetical protein